MSFGLKIPSRFYRVFRIYVLCTLVDSSDSTQRTRETLTQHLSCTDNSSKRHVFFSQKWVEDRDEQAFFLPVADLVRLDDSVRAANFSCTRWTQRIGQFGVAGLVSEIHGEVIWAGVQLAIVYFLDCLEFRMWCDG